MCSFVCMICIMVNIFLKENGNYKSPKDRIVDRILTCNFLEEGLRKRMKNKKLSQIHTKVVFLGDSDNLWTFKLK